MLRVLHEVAEREGNDAVGRLYTAIGTEWHVHGRREDSDGRPAGIRRRMPGRGGPRRRRTPPTPTTSRTTLRCAPKPTRRWRRTGGDVGTPIITIGAGSEAPRSFFGPVMPKAPKGDDAVALWNAVATLAYSDVAELKRTQRGDLVFD